jgi:hypothetical protein
MTALRTSLQNAFQTQLSTEMGPNDLTADVATIGALTSPCYLVVDYDSDSLREYMLFDGTFGGSSFVTSNIAKRYLSGSAAGSNLTHPIGAKVICAPVSFHIDDLHDVIDAIDHGDLAGLSGDDHPVYLLKAGGTLTGDLILDADPDADMKAATKQYVDNAAPGGVLIVSNSDQLPGVNLGSSNTFIDELEITIPAGWTTFYAEMYGAVVVDPTSYTTGALFGEITKSDDTSLYTCLDQIFQSDESYPMVIPINSSQVGATWDAANPISVADLIGDRIIKVMLYGRSTSDPGDPDAFANWIFKVTKVS